MANRNNPFSDWFVLSDTDEEIEYAKIAKVDGEWTKTTIFKRELKREEIDEMGLPIVM